MSTQSVTDAIEAIVIAGVAITTRALTRAAPELDLTFPQWRVLLVVGEDDEGMILSEIAHRVGVTLPATSRQVRRLAGRGLLEIKPDPRDRRAARVGLSPTGRIVRDTILAYRRERIREIMGSIRLSPEALLDLAAIAEGFRFHR